MKTRLLLFISLISFSVAVAQETEQRKSRLSDSVTEIYQVVKGNKYLKQGLYQALYRKKIVVATGMYEKNSKVGIWRFYSPDGNPSQTYDYTSKKLIYEAPEDTTSKLRYFVDRELKATDITGKPVKIGGHYYGYLPYLRLFTLPNDLSDINKSLCHVLVELLVSPGGRLAYYKVHLVGPNYQQVVNMNIKLPDKADTIFKPATVNGEEISCRIAIKAYITDDNHLDFE